MDTPCTFSNNFTIDNYTWYGAFTCIDKSSYSAISYSCVDGKEVNATSIVTCDSEAPYCIDCGEAPYGSAICLNTTVEPDYCNWTAFPILFDSPMNYTFDGNFTFGGPFLPMFYNMTPGFDNDTMWVYANGEVPLDGNFTFFDNGTIIEFDGNGTEINLPPFVINQTVILFPPDDITGTPTDTKGPGKTAGKKSMGKMGGMGMMRRMRNLGSSTMSEQETARSGGNVPKKMTLVRGKRGAQ